MKQILDIGCGNNKYPCSLGMDRVKLPSVDIIHDIEDFPYPFINNSFDTIVMQHVLEHVSKENMANIKIIEEAHRLLRPKGTLIVEIPLGPCFNFDPTHKNYVGYWYWNYFSEDFPLNYYTHARFKLKSAEIVGLHGIPKIEKLTKLANKAYQITPAGIERLICFLNMDMFVKYTLEKV